MNKKNICINKEYIDKILELISLTIKIRNVNIRVGDLTDKYDYFIHVYFKKEKGLERLYKIKYILNKIFKKENVCFLLYDIEEKCTIH